MYTDSHTHLYDSKLIADENQVQRAMAAGVTKMYMPNCDRNTISGMLEVADKWPANCIPMMGLHPCYVKEDYKEELAIVTGWMEKRKFAAIGEIGLDYHWDKTYVQQQKDAFEAQIDLALQYDLPIVIHSRESTPDCIEIVKGKQKGKLKGIFHCFGGTLEEAKQIIALGFYLGIGGVVTYKNTNLPELLQETGIANVVLETDAPYLAPVPYRGKRNESAYIPVIAARIAEVINMPIERVAAITTGNAEKIFPI